MGFSEGFFLFLFFPLSSFFFFSSPFLFCFLPSSVSSFGFSSFFLLFFPPEFLLPPVFLFLSPSRSCSFLVVSVDHCITVSASGSVLSAPGLASIPSRFPPPAPSHSTYFPPTASLPPVGFSSLVSNVPPPGFGAPPPSSVVGPPPSSAPLPPSSLPSHFSSQLSFPGFHPFRNSLFPLPLLLLLFLLLRRNLFLLLQRFLSLFLRLRFSILLRSFLLMTTLIIVLSILMLLFLLSLVPPITVGCLISFLPCFLRPRVLTCLLSSLVPSSSPFSLVFWVLFLPFLASLSLSVFLLLLQRLTNASRVVHS